MRTSIHQKLTKSYLILLMTVVLVMFIGSLLTVSLSTIPSMRLTMQSKSNELKNRVSEQFGYLDRAADTAFLNLNDISTDILVGDSSSSFTKYNTVNSSLYRMRLIYSDVEHAIFFDKQGNIYADNSLLEAALAENFDTSLHSLLSQQHGKTYCFGLVDIPCLNDEQPLLLVGKMIRTIEGMEEAGYLYVSARHSLLERLYSEQMICEGQMIYLCSPDGTVLSCSSPEQTGGHLDVEKHAAKSGLLVRHAGRLWLYEQEYLEDINAYIVLMVPMMKLYRTSGVSILLIVFAAIIGLCVAFFESSGISRRILSPLVKLTDTVDQVHDGNINIRCELESDDVVGVLASSFNSMLERIEALIDELNLEQQEKLRTELTVQQNKIQPHFLYNTINTISALCEMGRTEEASKMSMLVAKYYRSVLSDGKDIVTVQQELHFVELYFCILLCSRPDAFSYSIDCSPAVENSLIPKMTLQPLVENAIKHAFAGRQNNSIHISASSENGRILIRIKDNGKGMDVNEFSRITHSHDGGHFGIFSVCRRMELLCGGSYSLSARSEADAGTEITLSYDMTQALTGESANP